MGLIMPDSERDAHITHVARNEIINTLRLFGGRAGSFSEFVGFFFYLVVHRHAFALQLCIPVRNLIPVSERSQLYVGPGILLSLRSIFIAFRPDVLYHP